MSAKRGNEKCRCVGGESPEKGNTQDRASENGPCWVEEHSRSQSQPTVGEGVEFQHLESKGTLGNSVAGPLL